MKFQNKSYEISKFVSGNFKIATLMGLVNYVQKKHIPFHRKDIRFHGTHILSIARGMGLLHTSTLLWGLDIGPIGTDIR